MPVEAGLQARDVDADAPSAARCRRARGRPRAARAPNAFTTAIADSASLAIDAISPSWRRRTRARAAHAAAVDAADAEQRRRRGERDQRQHRVDAPAARRSSRAPAARPAAIAPSVLREQVAHGVDVAGHAREQVALLARLVEGEREPLQVVVDGDPQLVADPLAGASAATGWRSTSAAASASAMTSTSTATPISSRQSPPSSANGAVAAEQLVDDQRQRPRLGQVGGGQHAGGAAGAGERLPLAADVRAAARGRRGSWARHRREQGRPRVAAHQLPQHLAGAAAAVEVDRRRASGSKSEQPPISRGERGRSSRSGSSTRSAPSCSSRRARRSCSSSSGVAYGTTSAGTPARTISSVVL